MVTTLETASPICDPLLSHSLPRGRPGEIQYVGACSLHSHVMRLVLLFGGRSAEHDVSCVSASYVMATVDAGRYEVVPVGLTRDGCLVMATPHPEKLAAQGPEVSFGDVVTDDTVVFPLVHGPYGEDGSLQGLLEQASVPYIGSGVLGSALCMDKAISKEVLASNGLPQAVCGALRDVDFERDSARVIEQLGDQIGYPMFVKPANLGSSVGVSRVVDAAGLASALALAFSFDEWVVVEREVRGRELECGLLGYPKLEASGVGEVRKSRAFYDYADKYVMGAADLLVPAPLADDIAAEIAELALAAGRALRVEGMARADFFLTEGGELLINEVNTIPGFTPISMYPRLWDAAGVPGAKLIDRLVDAALDRYRHRAGRIGRPADLSEPGF